MKKSRHSEEKVIAAVKQMEGGRKTADVARENFERAGVAVDGAGHDQDRVATLGGALVRNVPAPNGEFVGAQVGLGYLVVTLNFGMDVPGVFAVLIVLSAIGLAMHGAMRYAARCYIFWMRRSEAPVMT